MSFVGVAVTGGPIVSGIMGANAAKDAAEAQGQAHRDAVALQKQIYEQNRADNEPYRKAGSDAITGMGNADFQRDFTAGDFQQDPGYAFRMAQGQQALERSAAARGGLQSGGTLKALSRYGQDYASNEYQNAYNRFNADRDRRFGRLNTIAGFGQNANQMNATGGMNYANQAGANMVGAADAYGAGRIGAANAYGGAINNSINNTMGLGSMMLGMGGMSGMSSAGAKPVSAPAPTGSSGAGGSNWLGMWKNNQAQMTNG